MSVPCEVCEGNIVRGFVVQIKKKKPEDETRFVCNVCVQDLFMAPQEYINHASVDIKTDYELAH